MKPIKFKYANRNLGPPENSEHSANVTGIDPLPVWSDGEQCVSCWKLSLKERFAALIFGRVWLAVLSGSTQPPVYVQASRTYLEGPPQCYLRGFSPFGLFNTVWGCLFGQVLVRVIDAKTGKTIRWFWDAAEEHPPVEHDPPIEVDG